MTDEREAWRQRDEYRDRAARAEDALEDATLARNAAINEASDLRDRLAAAEKKIEQLRLISNVNGDWNLRFSEAVRNIEMCQERASRVTTERDQALVECGRLAAQVAAAERCAHHATELSTELGVRCAELERWGREALKFIDARRFLLGDGHELTKAGAALLGREE